MDRSKYLLISKQYLWVGCCPASVPSNWGLIPDARIMDSAHVAIPICIFRSRSIELHGQYSLAERPYLK